MQLNLLVLRCKNIETSKTFYEKLGLKFIKEQHGKGVVHYSTYIGELVMELYPLKEGFKVENSRLGFSLDVEDIDKYLDKIQVEAVSKYEFDASETYVVVDPDGRKIEVKKV